VGPRQNWRTDLAFREPFSSVSATFAKLRNIYKVRSRTVHGTSQKVKARHEAERDAPELAMAVIRKAVEEGWPSSDNLDELALSATAV
jgi:hypothetical protein